jgi:hydrogenase maturation protease
MRLRDRRLSMTVLIACVGYRFMRDLSLGPNLIEPLMQVPWPQEVEVCDLHFGPIHMVHWLEERAGAFERMVFVAAVERGRLPGQIETYRWAGALPDADEIQQRVGEGVSGVISLDNLLIVGQHFQVLPPEVIVVEVEPEDTGWGPGCSPLMEAALPEILATVRRAAQGGYDG